MTGPCCVAGSSCHTRSSCGASENSVHCPEYTLHSLHTRGSSDTDGQFRFTVTSSSNKGGQFKCTVTSSRHVHISYQRRCVFKNKFDFSYSVYSVGVRETVMCLRKQKNDKNTSPHNTKTRTDNVFV